MTTSVLCPGCGQVTGTTHVGDVLSRESEAMQVIRRFFQHCCNLEANHAR
jgi:hypothetical protein